MFPDFVSDQAGGYFFSKNFARDQFLRIDDKEKETHPDYVVSSGSKDIGVASDHEDDRGHYVSVSPEEPSFAPIVQARENGRRDGIQP